MKFKVRECLSGLSLNTPQLHFSLENSHLTFLFKILKFGLSDKHNYIQIWYESREISFKNQTKHFLLNPLRLCFQPRRVISFIYLFISIILFWNISNFTCLLNEKVEKIVQNSENFISLHSIDKTFENSSRNCNFPQLFVHLSRLNNVNFYFT